MGAIYADENAVCRDRDVPVATDGLIWVPNFGYPDDGIGTVPVINPAP